MQELNLRYVICVKFVIVSVFLMQTSQSKHRNYTFLHKSNFSSLARLLAFTRIPRRVLFPLPYYFPSLYLVSNPFYQKDERALLESIQSHRVFLFPVINVESVTNARPLLTFPLFSSCCEVLSTVLQYPSVHNHIIPFHLCMKQRCT